MATVAGRPAAGVTVLTGPQITRVEGSQRESDPAGHYVIGVCKAHGTLVIIGGIYLDSTGQDQLGVTAIQQLSTHITELQQLYGTNFILLTLILMLLCMWINATQVVSTNQELRWNLVTF
jgi:hypothetical protein